MTKLFTLAIALASLAAIAVLAGLRDTVPVILAAVMLGAVTGQFALLRMPGIGPVVFITAAVVAIAVLASLQIPVPNAITGTLVAAVTGHFALTLPSTAPSSVAESDISESPPLQPAAAAAPDPNQPAGAGLSSTP
jgi:signal transduction histidine kinase